MDITRYSDPPWARIARIVFGAAFGTTIIVFAGVQVSLSRMHCADAGTLPNMAPQIRYLFILGNAPPCASPSNRPVSTALDGDDPRYPPTRRGFP